MICGHFVSNPFKEDICKNCQRGKATHPETPHAVNTTSSCVEFKANFFKPDLCATCQRSRMAHGTLHSESQLVAMPLSDNRTNLEVCDKYEEHAFKKNTCLNCKHMKELHHCFEALEGCEVDSFPIRGIGQMLRKDTQKLHVIDDQQKQDCAQNIGVISSKRFDVQSHQVSHTHEKWNASGDEALTTICSDFLEHAFKKNFCINCGKPHQV